MALIENLDHGDWREFLSATFGRTLQLLKNDRFAYAGSSVDDLKAWLTRGGIGRVKEVLAQVMEQRGYPTGKRSDILSFINHLAEEHRPQLIELAALNVIPASAAEWLDSCGITPEWVERWIGRMNAGERFDDWMYAHGHTDDDIVKVYGVIDDYLVRSGLLSTPPPLPSPRNGPQPS
jgi:hypothetical protein